jgi:hypothetical protein
MDTATIIAISLLIGGVISQVVISVASNLITDPTKEYLGKQSHINKRKKTAALKRELEYITYLHDNTTSLYCEIAENILALLIRMLFAITFMLLIILSYHLADLSSSPSFGTVFLILIAFFLLTFLNVMLSANRFLNLLRKIHYFDNYKQQMISRMHKLEIQE